MYLDLDKYLQQLKESWSLEADVVETAKETFPDLKAFQDPDGSVKFCSPTATPFADRLDVKHDSAGRTYVTAFIINDKVQVYADPPILWVGKYNTEGFGEIPNEGYQEQVEKAWGKDLAKRVKDHFLQHAPAYWGSEEGSEGDQELDEGSRD